MNQVWENDTCINEYITSINRHGLNVQEMQTL